MLKNFRFISVALIAMLCFSAMAFAQGTTGSIEGTVTDSTGAVIPGASVKVQSTGTTTGLNRSVTANDEGYFILARVAPGTYKVTIDGNGFSTSTRNVTVSVDRAASASAQLQAGGGTATVDVTGDSATTIDISDTKIDTNITREIIDSLPKGTTFGSLLKIAPNVRPEPLGGGFQIDGASGSENVFVIDGQEVTNFATGVLNANNNLPFELLQEVQVKSTGFEAEYGGATGGVINAVTAGGNNDWHGNFGISFTPSKFRGSPTQVLNRYGTGVGQFEYFDRVKDGGINYFPVASISGPLLPDKVWGLISYAPQIFEVDRTKDYYNTDDPGRNVIQTERYRTTVRREATFGRIDAQPFSSLRVYGTFLWNPQSTKGELPTSLLSFGAPSNTVEQQENFGGRVNSNAYNTQATWSPNNWMVLNFRTGRSFLNEKLGAYGRTAGQRFRVVGGFVDPCDFIPGRTTNCAGFDTGSNFLTAFDVSTRTTYDVDASFVGINAGGRHNIKVGYQLNRLYNNVDSGYTSTGFALLYYGLGIDAFTGSNVPVRPDCDFNNFNPNDDTCSLGTARLARIGTFGEASSDNTSIYAQDSWTINDRLTLNFGLRLENEVVPTFSDPNSTDEITFGWGDKLAPRFGVAYDLTGDGKTKLFGSYGWFYDRFKYELPRGLFGAETFQDAFAEITPARGTGLFDYTTANILGGRGIVPGGACPIASPTGFATCELDRRVPANTTGADPFGGAGAVDPDLNAVRQSEYTFGVERELGNNFVLAARFTHKQLDRVIEDIGAFNDQGSEAYIIGNPGIGLACEISQSSGLPCTKAERKYDAVEVRVDKRRVKYFFNASYTWSRLFGNYSGLASSDENGRTSPNVNRFFDLPLLGYTASGAPDNGLLATDRTHVAKAYGGYTFDWGDGSNATSVSGFTSFQSGTPVTTIYSLFGVGTAILNARGDLGRTPMFSETDLSISHNYKFGRDNKLTFQAFIEILNLFDENNITTLQRSFSGTNVTDSQLRTAGCVACTDEVATFQQLLVNGGLDQFVRTHFANNPTNVRNDYGQPNGFQVGRNVRFGFKFKF